MCLLAFYFLFRRFFEVVCLVFCVVVVLSLVFGVESGDKFFVSIVLEGRWFL